MSEEVSFKYKLGAKVKDRVSGYKGIIDGRKQLLNGCLQYSVQAAVIEKGELVSGWWIDEAQLELIGKGLNAKPVKKSKTGGPMTRVTR